MLAVLRADVRRFLLTLTALAFAACIASPAAALQGGYRTTEFEDLGFEIPVPRNYKAVPVEPTEKWIALKWVDEKTNARDREDYKGSHKSFLPELMVIWIDHVAVAAVTPSGGEGGFGDDPGADDEREKPIASFETYLERRWTRQGEPLYVPSEPTEIDDVDGNDVLFYELSPRKGAPPAWATVFRSARRSLVFFGRCSQPDWKAQEKIWRKMTGKIDIFPPQALDMSKWERFYERRPEYIDPEYRLKIRTGLVRGWEADDTENYIFVYSTKDQPLMRLIKRELEAMRAVYEELFPPAAPVTAVSTVRVCRDRDEYIQYGGSPWSGGYWNFVAEELVFYDYSEDEDKRGEGKRDSRVVLYHEAFHQFIFYSVGEVAPHSWYNEGTGDFFSGARISGSKVSSIGVNPWRIAHVKDVVEDGKHIPFDEILAFEQPEFYRPDRRSVCYSQAWSMIYFLRTAKEVEKHEQWSQILPVYFDTLKAEYAKEVEAMLADRIADVEAVEEGEEPPELPELSMEEKFVAGKVAREAALEVALADINLRTLENAWIEFVGDLKLPR